MAKEVVQQRGLAIRVACAVFSISESCYRYEPKHDAENALIADWLIRLTDNHRNWGFGLCYLYLRNVKGFGWNHKRVYRIYRELELNLRIDELRVPAATASPCSPRAQTPCRNAATTSPPRCTDLPGARRVG